VSLHHKLGPLCRAKYEAAVPVLPRRAHQGGLNQGVQIEVCRALRRLGLVVEMQVACIRSGLVLEILARLRGVDDACWVLDVEGHRHTLNCLWALKGAVLIKRRQIELLGYSLIILPEHEWMRAQGQGNSEADSYLRTKLHLSTLPAAPPPLPPPPPLAGLLPSVEMRLQGLFASGHASHEVKRDPLYR